MLIVKILIICASIILLLHTFKLLYNYRYLKLLKNVKLRSDFDWPLLSMIIPVCNEASTLKQSALSLFKTDYPNVEFIFVNDRSTDGTKQILMELEQQESRMKLIHIQELPHGWLGKVNALQTGLNKAQGEWILFTDADVHYQTQSLKKALSYSINEDLDFLTIITSIISPSKWTRILLAYLLHQFMILINLKTIRTSNMNNSIAQGAFMLFKKSSYEKTKGLEWIKMEVIDDMGFALMMKNSGARMDLLSGLDEVEIEWYTSIKGSVKGFEKNLFSTFEYSLPILFGYTIYAILFIMSYTIFPLIVNETLYYFTIWSCLGVYLFVLTFVLKKAIRIPVYSFILYIFAPLFFPIIAIRSCFLCLKNNGIYWRETFYSLDELKNTQRFKFFTILKNAYLKLLM